MPQNKTSTSMGLPAILTIIFVIARLANVITWSWWWVFSPLWIAGLIWIAILSVLLGLAVLADWSK